MASIPDSLLADDLLQRFHERAPVYDRENRFFAEDFEDLRKTGYLTMAVPKKYGGLGRTLAECMRETRRLAYWAPATALGTNMRHPVHVLEHGADVQEIVNMAAVAVIDAQSRTATVDVAGVTGN